jgi:hypothetical protein
MLDTRLRGYDRKSAGRREKIGHVPCLRKGLAQERRSARSSKFDKKIAKQPLPINADDSGRGRLRDAARNASPFIFAKRRERIFASKRQS